MTVKGKIALVTGASSGIGAAIALELGRNGATVAVNYRNNQEGAEKTVADIRANGGEAFPCRADVSDVTQVEAMFSDIKQRCGRLDALVNNAGKTVKTSFLEADEQIFSELFNVDLKSVFLCSSAAIKIMGPGSVILNISSIHAVRSVYGFELYGAIKAAVEALTRNMANNLGDLDIRVNAIRPDCIQVARDSVPPDSEMHQKMVNRIPAGRLGEVSDVAALALFLCSECSSYINGAVIPVDGGHQNSISTPYPKGYRKDLK